MDQRVVFATDDRSQRVPLMARDTAGRIVRFAQRPGRPKVGRSRSPPADCIDRGSLG